MRSIAAICFLALLICAAPAFAQDPAQKLYEFNSIGEALETIEGYGINGYAAEWITNQLDLKWPHDHKPLGTYGNFIRGYVSPNRRYCLLVGAKYGEWGPGGNAKYCLINNAGKVFWARESLVSSDPKVSNTGMSAILYRPLRNASEKGDELDYFVEVIDSTGSTAHVKKWHRRAEREMERGGAIREKYGFTLDGLLFFMTMNVFDETMGDKDRQEYISYNNTMLYLLDLDTYECTEELLGAFEPSIVSFPDSRSVIINGFWRIRINDNSQQAGDYRISEKGNVIKKRVYEFYEIP